MAVYTPKQKIDSSGNTTAIQFPASSINGLSTVATSGNYNDLSNKPTITIVKMVKWS